ncbi:hypothetical protein GSI_13383 [Ganoderma sinense ZZ0214-1]|uniref:F-box domain-containing protein n=1 Tax=Ganoderma sinense ZZ0214-1 TaxID=1077348 RepID=A0A2G8RVF8_9APHY|nr:hypothetical protein GSI_13383 [Ganoderma sinense ZZ0214-1]
MSMVPLEVHTLGDLDRSPALPVEVIERVVDFLHDDIHTLAVCSLICRALLPTTRKHIWSSVHIPVLHDRRPKTRRLAGFLALLDSNPDLPPYVRSLTWAWAASGGSTPAWSGFKRYRLWEKLPNVRALKFHRIAFFVIDPILELCRMFPCLEELVLDRVSAVAVGILRTSTQDQATYGTRKLKQLSISGAMSPRHVSALSEALLEEQLHSSLEILDLRCATYLSCRLGLYPSAKALPLLLTELAPHLRSCGIPIYSAEYNAPPPHLMSIATAIAAVIVVSQLLVVEPSGEQISPSAPVPRTESWLCYDSVLGAFTVGLSPCGAWFFGCVISNGYCGPHPWSGLSTLECAVIEGHGQDTGITDTWCWYCGVLGTLKKFSAIWRSG